MKKNKKLLLASIAAMGVLAMGVGATSTFAWYEATNNASVTAANAPGTVLSTESTLSLGSNFTVTITVTAPTVELSHYKSADKHLYRGGHYAAGDDRDVVISNDTDTQKCVKPFTVSAAWTGGAPTKQADLDYLDDKQATIVLDDAGYAQICTNNTYDADESGKSEGDISASFVLKFDKNGGGDAIVLTCGALTNGFVRVEPKFTDGSDVDEAEDHTGDKINVTTTTLTLEDQA